MMLRVRSKFNASLLPQVSGDRSDYFEGGVSFNAVSIGTIRSIHVKLRKPVDDLLTASVESLVEALFSGLIQVTLISSHTHGALLGRCGISSYRIISGVTCTI
jgi:hypothetical protein